MSNPLVGIIMGSKSEWPVMSNAVELLDKLGVAYEAKMVSAHRTARSNERPGFFEANDRRCSRLAQHVLLSGKLLETLEKEMRLWKIKSFLEIVSGSPNSSETRE